MNDRDIGVNLVIWANHNLRASVDAMQKTSAQIFKDQSLSNVESKVVPVAEVKMHITSSDRKKEQLLRVPAFLPSLGIPLDRYG